MEFEPAVSRRQILNRKLAGTGGELDTGGWCGHQLHTIASALVLLVDMAPHNNLHLRKPIHHLPERIPVGEPDFFHPVRADIYRVVMQGNNSWQTRMLLKGFREKIQLRVGQSPKNLTGHRGVQHDELPASLNHMSVAGTILAGNFQQVINMIMITGNPD